MLICFSLFAPHYEFLIFGLIHFKGIMHSAIKTNKVNFQEERYLFPFVFSNIFNIGGLVTHSCSVLVQWLS